ncbi:hypothetical protein NDU88_002212 [Pleurodeles waltl]|uniref:L1 transposable element RRM domain-containing protein n=1 Tax=Pleurodeles waltl TaxID=8319 RepID=A0AAV7LFB6_PLEWA|nr:hypothetical protein NDU88_002212 [Pleurodeles waltl]
MRSSLPGIQRPPGEIRRGVKDPHSTRRPGRRAGTTEKVQINGEAQTTMSRDRDQDLLFLRSKLMDMEDRSRRDNIRLHGISENEEGVDVQSFLRSALPKLTSLEFDPPIEFQRAHRVGPKHPGNPSRPRPIIACLLRHNQTRQILQVARKHGPFQMDQHDIRITADYSKETNDRRKAFLALRPRLRQLEIKYSLFDPARMWLTKNGVSKDFYNPEELQLFLDSFQPQSMDSTSTNDSHDNGGDNEGNLPPAQEKTDMALCYKNFEVDKNVMLGRGRGTLGILRT